MVAVRCLRALPFLLPPLVECHKSPAMRERAAAVALLRSCIVDARLEFGLQRRSSYKNFDSWPSPRLISPKVESSPRAPKNHVLPFCALRNGRVLVEPSAIVSAATQPPE